jgi:WD40 repeat protein
LAISSDGRRVLCCPDAESTLLLDIETGGRIQGFPQPAEDGALSSSGRFVATTKNYEPVCGVCLWDVVTGKLRRTIPNNENFSARGVAFSPDESLLAVHTADSEYNHIDLIAMSDGERKRRLTFHYDTVRDLAFSPNGRLLATASDASGVRVWEVATGRLRASFKNDLVRIWSVMFFPDGNRLAAGADDTTVLIWRIDGN